MNPQSLAKDYRRLSETLPALKGLGICMVVIYHLWGYTKGYPLIFQISLSFFSSGVKGILEGLLNIFCLLGEYGVHFFLIASGFGLASSWWREGKSAPLAESFPSFEVMPFLKNSDRYQGQRWGWHGNNITTFWQRRLLRLFPLYWLAHGLALIIAWVQPDWVPFGREVFGRGGMELCAAVFISLTTLRNFILSSYFFLNGAWWYVGLAVQLYLIFPLLMWVGKRWGWSLLLSGSLVTSLIYRGIIIALPLNEMAANAFLRGAFFSGRLFEFSFGIVLAIALLEPASINRKFINPNFWIKKQGLWANVLLWLAGVACDWAADAGWIFLIVPADALIGVGEFGLCFQLLSFIPQAKPGLSLLGNYSYGIYLSHMNLMVGLWAVLTPLLSAYWLRLGLVTAIACFLGGAFEFAYQWGLRRFFITKNA